MVRPLVGFSKSGNLEPHIVSSKIKCVGVGQPRQQVLAWMKLADECRKEKSK